MSRAGDEQGDLPVGPQPDADLMRLRAGDTVAVIDAAHGGRLASFVVDGRELLVQQGADVFHWGSFPLAPWVGRVRHGRFSYAGRVVRLPINSPPHALHGLVADREWTVHGQGSLAVEITDSWPWPCRVVQSVVLSDQRIDFGLEVHAEVPMPVDIGWHPWFNRQLVDEAGVASAPVELVVQPGRMYLNGSDGLPSGQLGPPVPRPWDYCFVELAGPPVVRWGDLLEVSVHSDCSHWVFYDQEQQGICVEPWTGPPNSLNLPNRTIVTADQPLRATMTWTWRRPS